jgi:hypothetical protein
MNLELRKYYGLVLLALGTAAAIFAGRSVHTLATQPLPTVTEWPNPEHLDSLSVYLSPVRPRGAAGFGFDEESFDDPFEPPRSRPAAAPPAPAIAAGPSHAPAARPRHALVVSAILISDVRRVAVIDNALFAVGDRLPGGARVAAIEKDRVVVVQPDGMRRSLPVESGGQS